MTTSLLRTGSTQRILCLILAVSMAAAPSASAVAQTNAAAMAVRQQVEGFQRPQGQEGPGRIPPQPASGPGQPVPSEPTTGAIDTRYLLPNAAVVIDLRPARILAAPLGQLLPAELVTAFTGFDPAEMDEVVAFLDTSKLPMIGYGVTFKFKNPIRAASIPVERRTHVQLAELAGKKYLQSSVPMMYSLYGPNNRTLVAATDPELHQLVESSSQPKSGPMMDRIHQVPAGSDVYIAVDVASLRPILPMFIPQLPPNAPPGAKQSEEALSLVSAAELTLNLSNSGPTSLVLQCNDDAAAQKLEALLHGIKQEAENVNPTEQPGTETPIMQAVNRYMDRLSQPFQPQRSGTSITCFRLDEQNPGHQQLVSSMVVLFASIATMAPFLKAKVVAAQRNRAFQNTGGVPGPGGTPAAPTGEQRR
jgi:hypothetical protein